MFLSDRIELRANVVLCGHVRSPNRYFQRRYPLASFVVLVSTLIICFVWFRQVCWWCWSGPHPTVSSLQHATPSIVCCCAQNYVSSILINKCHPTYLEHPTLGFPVSSTMAPQHLEQIFVDHVNIYETMSRRGNRTRTSRHLSRILARGRRLSIIHSLLNDGESVTVYQ